MVDLLQLATGLVIVVVGLVPAVLPRATADTGEIIDAIGSKTPPSEIEATEWKVTLTRFVGVATVALGLAFVGAALSPRV